METATIADLVTRRALSARRAFLTFWGGWPGPMHEGADRDRGGCSEAVLFRGLLPAMGAPSRASEIAADGFIPKPFDLDELLALMRRYLPE